MNRCLDSLQIGERDVDAVRELRATMKQAPVSVVGAVPAFAVRPLVGRTWGSIKLLPESTLESQDAWDTFIASTL